MNMLLIYMMQLVMHIFDGKVLAIKPRQGPMFLYKNRTRARFKSAMRYIKRHEDNLRRESLAKKLLRNNNNKDFWKEIK
jgi:hypothetical protein